MVKRNLNFIPVPCYSIIVIYCLCGKQTDSNKKLNGIGPVTRKASNNNNIIIHLCIQHSIFIYFSLFHLLCRVWLIYMYIVYRLHRPPNLTSHVHRFWDYQNVFDSIVLLTVREQNGALNKVVKENPFFLSTWKFRTIYMLDAVYSSMHK